MAASRMRHCCFALAAPVLLVAVLLALPGESPEGERCLAKEDCVCPFGKPSRCHEGKCFGGASDDRCVGQANGHSLGDGKWCWNGALSMRCACRRQNQLKLANKRFMDLLERLGGQFWGKALPLLARMWLRADDRLVQVQGCSVMSQFGWNVPESKEPLMRLGAIDLAMSALKRFHGDRQVEDACINGMAALSLYNRPVSLRVGELGGVELTASYWVRNFEDRKAVAVASYFGCYQDFSPENRERMRRAGAIRLAFDACGEGGKFFSDAEAQFWCWCGFSSFHTEANHAEFRRLGGMRHTYVVFRDHGKSYRVREEILQATKGLCAHRVNREDLAREGFMELLADAVRTEKRDPQIQALGLETLRMFVESNATLRARLIEVGGVESAFEALDTHAAKLIDTRSSWDSQNVYGSLNDNQYNVPGAASEILYSMAKHGPEVREAMVAGGAVRKLDAAIEATQSRVPSVKFRTFNGACQVLFLLTEAAEAAGQGAERRRVASLRGCSERPEFIRVITNDVDFEP